ncbi:hypothetical protein ABZV58_11905 [Nocardia sp. NPDC004654]|uniref:hypothetical protein n=1 Tax=Nocardia sp. NPDC004654 TaxID=3154776 RepID=UPI0033BA0072
MTNVENDPDMLRKAAQVETGQVRDAIESVLTNLDSALAARGTPWGNDKFGSRFHDGADGYAVSKSNARTNLSNASQSYDNFVTGQVRTADTMKKQDIQNRDDLS